MAQAVASTRVSDDIRLKILALRRGQIVYEDDGTPVYPSPKMGARLTGKLPNAFEQTWYGGWKLRPDLGSAISPVLLPQDTVTHPALAKHVPQALVAQGATAPVALDAGDTVAWHQRTSGRIAIGVAAVAGATAVGILTWKVIKMVRS